MNSHREDAPPNAAAVPSRHQLQLDRQARVGILRNRKEPPRLPPRKAALTGKWLDLRSRRRLRREGEDLLALSPRDAGPNTEAGPDELVAPAPDVTDRAILTDASQMNIEPKKPSRGRLDGLRFVAGLATGLAFAGLGAVAASWYFGLPG